MVLSAQISAEQSNPLETAITNPKIAAARRLLGKLGILSPTPADLKGWVYTEPDDLTVRLSPWGEKGLANDSPEKAYFEVTVDEDNQAIGAVFKRESVRREKAKVIRPAAQGMDESKEVEQSLVFDLSSTIEIALEPESIDAARRRAIGSNGDLEEVEVIVGHKDRLPRSWNVVKIHNIDLDHEGDVELRLDPAGQASNIAVWSDLDFENHDYEFAYRKEKEDNKLRQAKAVVIMNKALGLQENAFVATREVNPRVKVNPLQLILNCMTQRAPLTQNVFQDVSIV
ncbi:hypothetical protein HY029_01395 [Candidatus Gottesmanbacteria bacterium]|nr:hypothetical protein [Candidatus Gottesmanbacteria bacterium]